MTNNRTIPPFVRSVDSSFPHTETPAQPSTAVPQSRWVSYMRASGAPRRTLSPLQHELADSIWAAYDEKRERNAEQEGLLSDPSTPHTRKEWISRQRRRLMRNPFAPLFFRIFIMATTIIALALSSDINEHRRPCWNRSTHLLAIIVNSIAIPYTLYISWDEFFSPPIGLRKSRSKLRLLVLDLVFIIFYSADLALAFEAVTHPDDETDVGYCAEQAGLVAVLMIALLAWLSTFLLSLFRLLYKVEGDM